MNQISETLNRVLMVEDRGIVEAVAIEAGISYMSVYGQLRRNVNPSLDVVKAAFLVTHDPRIKAALEPVGWELCPKADTVHAIKGPEAETVDVILSASHLVDLIREVKKDGTVDPAERIALLKALAGLRREVAEAEKALQIL